jgi:ketosteroid isomerase-like protein
MSTEESFENCQTLSGRLLRPRIPNRASNNEPKSKFILLLLANLAVGQIVMQTTHADVSADPNGDERAIISIEYKLGQAYLSGDADYLDSILSPDFILTNVRGEVSNKAQEVAEVRNRIIHYEKFETSNVKVALYGDAAVATGRTAIKGTVEKSGRIIDAQIRLTDTFVRQKTGKWQMVAGQTTLIPSEASTSSQRLSGGTSGAGEGGVSAADGRSDFDSFMGNWRVHHRRLKERLSNNHEWIEFEGTSTAQKILGDLGNMDDNVLNFPAGAYRAVTFRTYDQAKKLWSIWWIDSRNPGTLDPPVVGRFENGVGTFYADDTFKGKPIRIRYLWTNLSTTPHWEQAFSEDEGKTWETNWTMDFTRTQ